MFTMKKAPESTKVPEKKASDAAAKQSPSTQEWIPFKDIRNNLLFRKDNSIVAFVRVQPVNLNLLSVKERKRKVKQLEEVLNGIDYNYQIYSIPKPVDLDAYIMKLENLRSDTEDVTKKRLLGIYIKQAVAKATGGEAVERQFYILIDHKLTKKPQLDEQVVLQRATELASNLSSAELLSHVCNDAEIRTLQFLFFNSAQAAFERAPLQNVYFPPMVVYEEPFL